MPQPKVKKCSTTTLLKFRKPSMEDIILSEDEAPDHTPPEKVTENSHTVDQEEELPPNQEAYMQQEIQQTKKAMDMEVTKPNTNTQKNRTTTINKRKRTLNDEDLNPCTKKKKLTVKQIMENQEPDEKGMGTILSLWMMLWFEGIMKFMEPILKKMVMMALKERMITSKKIVSMMHQGTLSILKDLKLPEIELEQFSIEDFVRHLQDQELFMIFTRHWVCQEDADWITNNFIKCLPEQCLLSSTTATTSMSSTIVPTPTAVADVNSPTTSRGQEPELAGDILDRLFRHSNTTSSTGAIQQSIARRDGDYVITLKSPGECGYRVIKLDVYDFNKICNLPKEQWWKQATYRSTFLTSSPVDHKETLVQKLLSLAAVELQKIPQIQKEEKAMKSFFSYKSDRHHQ